MKQELRSLALLLFGILLVEASRAIGGFDVDERRCLLLLSGIAFGLWGLIRMFYPKESAAFFAGIQKDRSTRRLTGPSVFVRLYRGICQAFQSRISLRPGTSTFALVSRMMRPFSAVAPAGSPPMPMGVPSAVFQSSETQPMVTLPPVFKVWLPTKAVGMPA